MSPLQCLQCCNICFHKHWVASLSCGKIRHEAASTSFLVAAQIPARIVSRAEQLQNKALSVQGVHAAEVTFIHGVPGWKHFGEAAGAACAPLMN